MKNVQKQKKEMIDLIKSIEAIQIKGELHLNDSQESVYFIRLT